MSYVVLARKWRPKKFSEMVGQEHVLQALGHALDSGKVHHAFLFTGTRGVGKTTIARILAKSLNCETGLSSHPCGICSACRSIDEGRFIDLIEVDAASRTKVDDTRELLDNVQYAPTNARFKVYLIDEVHMLSTHSFNALLKTLEEPPPHVKFLLATTDPQRLPVTVLSRCLQFSLKRLPAPMIAARMAFIASEEKLEFEAPALALIARAADGSLRDALSLLDQLIAFGGGNLSEANARQMLGSIDRGRIVHLLDALVAGDGAAMLREIAELDKDAPDYDQALIELAAWLQRIAIAQIVPKAAAEDEHFDPNDVRRLAGSAAAEDVQLYYQIALGGRRDLAMAPDPRSGFEMTMLRMLAFRPDADSEVHAGSGLARTSAPQRAALTPQRAALPPQTAAAPAAKPAPRAESSAAAGAASALDAQASASIPPEFIDAGNWTAVLDAAQISGLQRQFALNCLPKSFENEVLKLSLEAVAADRLTKQIEDRLVQGLSKYMGRDIRIIFETIEQSVATPARQRTQDEQERQRRAVAAFDDDPAVRGLRERFGATVESGSVKPS
jgi:DNA polymerase III subunit gamma/tau